MVDVVEGCLPASSLTYRNHSLNGKAPADQSYRQTSLSRQIRGLFLSLFFKRVIKIVRISKPEEIIDDFVSGYPVAINSSGRMPPGYNLYMQQYAR